MWFQDGEKQDIRTKVHIKGMISMRPDSCTEDITSPWADGLRSVESTVAPREGTVTTVSASQKLISKARANESCHIWTQMCRYVCFCFCFSPVIKNVFPESFLLFPPDFLPPASHVVLSPSFFFLS